LAILGCFGQIQLLWHWLTACPHLEGKKENVLTFAKSFRILCVMPCWKALRISHPLEKFKKIQLQIEIVGACQKSLNSIYGINSLLGVKAHN
jgi:hypothetical protein